MNELQAKGALDLKNVQELADRISRSDSLAQEVDKLKRANSELTAILGNLKLLGSDIAKLQRIEAALAAATKINPNDPPELLNRAVEVLKRLGADTRPEQVKAISELITESEKLKALQGALGTALSINPNDPVEVIERALAVLNRAEPDTKPDQIVPKDQHAALSKAYEQTRRELDKLKGPGNGLTMPSCWKGKPPEEAIEYIFDITIRDDGVVVRDASPGRAQDRDWALVGQIPRNEIISEAVLTRETTKLLAESKKRNCRYYAIVRDATGEGKQRYKPC